ncbi:MAG: ribokinase, partial [Chloroflexi bacterium]|nr:ribokinase [Chloroflexota bacterium]
MPPEFLVIGHVVQDLSPQTSRDEAAGWRLGGTASYAALLAARLGLRTAVLTAAAPDLPLEEALPGTQIARVPSTRSTQFRNVYTAQGRVQYVLQRAPLITAAALPDDWRGAGIVLLGPVAGEVDAALADCFPQALIGVSAQGWLREIGPDSRVRPVPPERWQGDPLLRQAHVLFVSDEDLPPSSKPVLEKWSRRVDTLAYTSGEHGAEVCHRGAWRRIDHFPAKAVDPTGAGDIFATAFLVRYHESGDPWQATR